MKIQGRLIGHFLKRVALLIGALGLVFMIWLVLLVVQAGRLSDMERTPAMLLKEAENGATLTPTGEVALSAETSAAIAQGPYWLQVLDAGGDVVSAIDAAETVPRHYTPGELVLYRRSPERIDQIALHTWATAIEDREYTLVLGQPEETVTQRIGDYAFTRGGATVLSLIVLMLAGMLVLFGVAAVFARTLARPINHMMQWLGALADGDYSEPVDRKGRPVSRTRDGRSRRKAYRTYREVFDSLDALTQELRHAKVESERLEMAREEWVAGITHDLRTPLSSVRGYADVLASDYDFEPDEIREHAAIIGKQASHIDELIDDLMLTFRLNADALPLNRSRVDLVELVRDAAIDTANDPRATGQEIVFVAPPGDERLDVDIDSALVRRAIGNLLTNAAVHNPAGTGIRVHVARRADRASIMVADDGIGMDAETLSRLFDRYYRGTSTETGSDGSGLGMAIARQVVETHGGTITATSRPGAGTTVVVELPIA